MMKIDELNSNPNNNFNPKKPIFLSLLGGKKINKKLNIHLFNKISYSFEISTLILKKLFHKMGILYTELLYIIENMNFDINKILLFLSRIPNN